MASISVEPHHWIGGKNGFGVMISGVACEGLEFASWFGKILDNNGPWMNLIRAIQSIIALMLMVKVVSTKPMVMVFDAHFTGEPK